MGQKFKKLDCTRGVFRIFFAFFTLFISFFPSLIIKFSKIVIGVSKSLCKTDLVLSNSCGFRPNFDFFVNIFCLPLLISSSTPPPNPLQKNLTFWKVSGRKEDHPMMGIVTYFDWLIEWLIGCTNGWNQLPRAQLWVQISVYCIGTK